MEPKESTAKSALIERDRNFIWHPFTQAGMYQEPLLVTAAKGTRLILDDGRELIDGISSWWCNIHGHGHPALVAAAATQFATLDHVLFAGCTHEPAITLAERILAALPRGFSKVFFSDNGSTAVEAAIKLAVQYWSNHRQRRNRIIALTDSYHGDTFGAMAAGARGIFSAPFDTMLFHVDRVSTRGDVEDISMFERLCSENQVAAFIFEPSVQGAGGMIMYDTELLNKYREICREYDVLTIADEVMTGFGRTGPLFASSTLTTPPDIMCLSKALTSGSLPLALTVCSERIADAFVSPDHSRTFFHGHTYTANPIACAVANASLELTLSDECSRARVRIEEAQTRCADRLRHYTSLDNIRVRGTILAFDVRTDDQAGYTSAMSRSAGAYFRARGVLLRPLGNVIYFMPPYCITDSELSHTHTLLEEFAAHVARHGISSLHAAS
jgi:adenosylmethionine-8-amino-7-oxononanoate aminotransferase